MSQTKVIDARTYDDRVCGFCRSFVRRLLSWAAEGHTVTADAHVGEVEEFRTKYQRAYEDAMRDIGTKYALYCPGCGKVMTLQHASRLPAEAQGQLCYVPPAEEPEEPAKAKARGRR